MESLFISFQPATLGAKVTSTLGHWIRACITRSYEAQALPFPQTLHEEYGTLHEECGHKCGMGNTGLSRRGLLCGYLVFSIALHQAL